LYCIKFPELESLVPDPVLLAKTVKAIGNETDITKVNLKGLLPQATVMVITVTATTTPGRELKPDELAQVLELCDVLLEMEQEKQTFLLYVESKMNVIAPNLSVLLGSSVAAKVTATAGNFI
jgi:U4/U6 small nuclear ribonucleoprotein PRP31